MPIKSTFADVSIPVVDSWTYYLETPRRYPENHPIFIDANTRRSYTIADIRRLGSEFGKGLRHVFQLEKGDIVGFYTPNDIDTPLLTLAIHWAGGVPSPANPAYTVDELVQQLRDSEPKLLLTQKSHLTAAVRAAALANIPADRVLLMGDGRDETGVHRHWTDITARGARVQPRRPVIDPKTDLAYLVYSSGTTGLPKGVALTHYNRIANAVQSYRFDIQGMFWDRDSQIGVLPMYHAYGLGPVIDATLSSGAPCIVMVKFELERLCQVIQDFDITFLYVLPPIILALGKDPVVDKYDLTSLRWINSGAASLGSELTDSIWKRLGVRVKQAYGLSETSPMATSQIVEEFWKLKGSIGRLVPSIEAMIVDDDGNEVAQGEPGELLLRGPSVFSGYWKRPDLQSDTFTDDGWFKTGDVVYIDPKGFLYLTDRKKDLVKYKGFQVPPAELEGKLLGREDIIDVGVIGVWDKERYTEIPRAYVVVRPGVEETAEKAREIVEWLNARVAPFKKLRGGVRFVKEIPKSPSGKILKRKLRERAEREEAPRAKL